MEVMFQTLERQWNFIENSIAVYKRKRLLFKSIFSDCHKRIHLKKNKYWMIINQ
jgi:hypothetical protein